VTLASLAVAVGLTLGHSGATALDLKSYRARLASIEGLLLAHDRARAAEQARALLGCRIDWGTELLPPDRSVLEPITKPGRQGVVAPLRALLTALPEGATPSLAAPPVDRQALLALALRDAEDSSGPTSGRPWLSNQTLSETLTRWLKSAKQWTWERLRDAWRWLRKWLRRWWGLERPEASNASPRLVKVVLVGVGAILLVVLLAALLTLKKRDAALPTVALAPAPDVDADPLSRTTNEWVLRAQALAQAGRQREAIRAWYHALLVSCYRTGLLHHRTGWTNWEYVRSLASDVPWRSRFAELTGRFDLEWYGRAQSSDAALDAFAGEARAILGELGGMPA
jgi:Domain of unknown function (DUF4129)